MAALGVLRAWAAAGEIPPRSAAAGRLGRRGGSALRAQPLRQLGRRRQPRPRASSPDARDAGRASDRRGPGRERRRAGAQAPEARSRLQEVGAYLELHIEQGPVLEAEGVSAAAVTGCVGHRALALLLPRPDLARGDDADGRCATTPAWRRPTRRSGSSGSRLESWRAWRPRAASSSSRGSPPPCREPPSSSPTSATPRRERAGGDAGGGARAGPHRGGGARLRVWRPSGSGGSSRSALRPGAGRAGAQRLLGGRRLRADADQRRPPRRRRGGARDPRSDGLLPVAARPQPHPGGGHRRGGPQRRASRPSACSPARVLRRG